MSLFVIHLSQWSDPLRGSCLGRQRISKKSSGGPLAREWPGIRCCLSIYTIANIQRICDPEQSVLLGKLSRSVALRVSLTFVIFEKRYIVFLVKAVLSSIKVCKRQKVVSSCRRGSYAKSTQVFTRRQFAERGGVSRDRIYRERLLVAAQCSLRRNWGTRWRPRRKIGGRRVRCDASEASALTILGCVRIDLRLKR